MALIRPERQGPCVHCDEGKALIAMFGFASLAGGIFLCPPCARDLARMLLADAALCESGSATEDSYGDPPPQLSFDVMPFGRYYGTPVSELPDHYLLWLTQQGEFHMEDQVRAAALKRCINAE